MMKDNVSLKILQYGLLTLIIKKKERGKMLRNTYEKGAAFAEGQSSNRSSTVRESQVCEKDEVDTAGE